MKFTRIVFLILLVAKLTFYRELSGWWLASPLILEIVAAIIEMLDKTPKN